MRISVPKDGKSDALLIREMLQRESPEFIVTRADRPEAGLKLAEVGGFDLSLLEALARSERLRRATLDALNTQVKRKEALERERVGLNQALVALDQVLGIVGHELRSPLAAIRAMTEFLADERTRETPQCRQFLNAVNAEVIRMSDIVDTVLEAARLNSGRARWNWGTFEVGPVCREASESVRPLVGSRVELSCQARPASASMRGDIGGLRRLAQNLLSNAIKHTPTGRIDVEAAVFEREGQWLELSVSDTGTGIDPATLSGLGEAFALNCGVVGMQVTSGLGLGLFICRGIAAAHGGRLTIRSTQGAGTTVVATLRADMAGPQPTQDTAPLDARTDPPAAVLTESSA